MRAPNRLTRMALSWHGEGQAGVTVNASTAVADVPRPMSCTGQTFSGQPGLAERPVGPCPSWPAKARRTITYCGSRWLWHGGCASSALRGQTAELAIRRYRRPNEPQFEGQNGARERSSEPVAACVS